MKRNRFLRLLKRSLIAVFVLFAMMNILAALHAWNFTHFDSQYAAKTDDTSLSAMDLTATLICGVNNPKPVNDFFPKQKYEAVLLGNHSETECWYISAKNPVGSVVICHGYGGSKASMMHIAAEFLAMGYNCLLPDFYGSGGSAGNFCTIGFKESQQVADCYQYLWNRGESNIILYGTSMGAAAIMKAVKDSTASPTSVILECPFGSLYQTVQNRFEILGVPEFPMAGLLTFWGGVENGFDAFSHNPEEYAKRIHCPVLLMYGEEDRKVKRSETDAIYNNLRGTKQLVVFPATGHENYLVKNKEEWLNHVSAFLSEYNQ
jgi:alpha-beta hydrolase superfamily lysophospholipase